MAALLFINLLKRQSVNTAKNKANTETTVPIIIPVLLLLLLDEEDCGSTDSKNPVNLYRTYDRKKCEL